MRPTILLIALSATLAACSGDSDTSRDATSSSDTAFPSDTPSPDLFGPDTSSSDTSSSDTSSSDTTPPPPGTFGAPCRGNIDCASGWCVEGLEGYACTRECLEDCPGGYDCKSMLNAVGDPVFLCVPRVQKLCTPCTQDLQCNGGACLDIDGSMQCAARCDEPTDCPQGYLCEPDPTGTVNGSFCQPKSGSCDCSPPYAGVARTCSNTNAIGTCLGVETCDPDVGWVGCTARDAAPETCDYVDNDCNGQIDETFKTSGTYSDPTSCGSCDIVCADVLANADETACVLDAGAARCQVVTCKPGFTALNPYVCAPDVSNLCQPCTTAAECLGLGAACTTLTDGTFCTRACGTGGTCATGFTCRATADGDQCVPESGSCTCDGSNTSLARSCSVTFTPPGPNQPAVTCNGLEQCTAQGWGTCTLPSETCDGVDNDCDGVVDQPFKTGDRYTHLEHCGACGNSCLAFAFANATPSCDTTSAIPTCAYHCTGTAVDVNGLSDDGCECIPTPGPDLAGDDLDSNCDGVDGEIDNAIFVSKEGNDTNPGTLDLPVLTIQTGIAKAKAAALRDVYVATGVYSQNLILEEGVGVFGGYAPAFDAHNVLLYETALIGQSPDATHWGTVTALSRGLGGASDPETVLHGFTVFGPNAANASGQSSYAIYVRDSGPRLRLQANIVVAGPGGPGAAGTPGEDGANGANGAPGIPAKNISGTCSPSTGGQAGARTCASSPSVDVGGGVGGNARCPLFGSGYPPAANSKGGQGKPSSGGGAGGSAGWDSRITSSSSCGTCTVPNDGNGNQLPFTATPGGNGSVGARGQAGQGGSSGGTIAANRWQGAAGSSGGAGNHGAGGGGGGAGGGVAVSGCSSSAGGDDVGGSGGGGGSGGCRGTGGAGGTAGGGSFGIFFLRTTGTALPTLLGNSVFGGSGGIGGPGGRGGVGGQGGAGGLGGAPDTENGLLWCANGGAQGGNGGAGGHGGGGGGGAGGVSYGLFASLASGTPPAAWKTGNTFQVGQGGQGGAGGASFDTAAQGTAGQNGTQGATNF